MSNKLKIELFFHAMQRSYETEFTIEVRTSDWNNMDDYTMLGSIDVEIDIPDFDKGEVVVKQVNKLKEEKKTAMALNVQEINELNDRIAKLLALPSPLENTDD